MDGWFNGRQMVQMGGEKENRERKPVPDVTQSLIGSGVVRCIENKDLPGLGGGRGDTNRSWHSIEIYA